MPKKANYQTVDVDKAYIIDLSNVVGDSSNQKPIYRTFSRHRRTALDNLDSLSKVEFFRTYLVDATFEKFQPENSPSQAIRITMTVALPTLVIDDTQWDGLLGDGYDRTPSVRVFYLFFAASMKDIEMRCRDIVSELLRTDIKRLRQATNAL